MSPAHGCARPLHRNSSITASPPTSKNSSISLIKQINPKNHDLLPRTEGLRHDLAQYNNHCHRQHERCNRFAEVREKLR